MSDKTIVPSGRNLYIEAGLEHLADGELLDQLNDALRTAYRMTEEWEHATGKNGSFEVTVKLMGERCGREHYGISAKISMKTPSLEIKQSVIRTANGRILCDRDGSVFNSDKDQLKLFSGSGELVHTVDTETGEIVDDKDIVGQVRAEGAS